MSRSTIRVVEIRSESELPFGWERHENVVVDRVTDLAAAIAQPVVRGEHRLLDLSSSAGRSEKPSAEFERLLHEGNTSVLAGLRPGTLPSRYFTEENLSSGRVFLFAPLVYHPVFIEIRRVIGAKTLGRPAGIDIIIPSNYPVQEVLFAACLLFGVPSGYRRGEEEFLWFDRCGCRIERRRGGEKIPVTIQIACKLGTLSGTVIPAAIVRLFPAGSDAYRLPLPDGNGIYYNQQDVLDVVSGRHESPAFTPADMIRAFRWLEATVHEGT